MFGSLVRYAGGISQFCGMTCEWRGQFSVETCVDSGLILIVGRVTLFGLFGAIVLYVCVTCVVLLS